MPVLLACVHRLSHTQPTSARPLSEDRPPVDQILSTRIRLRSSVPFGRVTSGEDVSTRPSRGSSPTGTPVPGVPPVFGYFSPMRGGTSRTRRSTNETRRRCPATLGPAPTCNNSGLLPGATSLQESNFELDDRTASKVHTHIKEGALRRDCTAFTSEPPVAQASSRRKAQASPPGPSAGDRDVTDEFRVVGPGRSPSCRPRQGTEGFGKFRTDVGGGAVRSPSFASSRSLAPCLW